ncbi:hypothetical protein BD770DRAFT_386764 [Pilaira anomala]|nr:hypothetical protein BD770DRAFT_386764 [Pilaira anomala]
MNPTNKPKINILLFGSSGVGKTSLCQAFGSNFAEGFSYGFGLSKKAKIVEFVTERNVYHIIDAPGIYDPQNEVNTQKHAYEMTRILNLSSTPYVICFVICIQENTMSVKPSDFIMMKTIARYYNQGQVKFSVIVNRLTTENGFSVISNNSQYRGEFLKSFERNGNVPITDDDILLIHDRFLYHSQQEQKELLTSYLRKFEAGHLPEFEQNTNNKPHIINDFSMNDPMAFYNSYMASYQSQLNNILGQTTNMDQQNMYQQQILKIQQQQQLQQQQNLALFQQIMGGKSAFAGSNSFGGGGGGGGYGGATTTTSPYQQTQQVENPFINQFTPGSSAPQSPAVQENPYAANFQFIQQLQQNAIHGNPYNSYPSPNDTTTAFSYQQSAFGVTEDNSQKTSTSNTIFEAAGAFVGGAMGVPSMSSGSSNPMYGVAGTLVNGAVTAGCTIM